jgi:hypothetical protein
MEVYINSLFFYCIISFIYIYFYQVLLERISPTSLTPVLKEGEEDAKTLVFKNPEFLAPIFELLCMGAQIDIQRRALQDFSALLSKVRISRKTKKQKKYSNTITVQGNAQTSE